MLTANTIHYLKVIRSDDNTWIRCLHFNPKILARDPRDSQLNKYTITTQGYKKINYDKTKKIKKNHNTDLVSHKESFTLFKPKEFEPSVYQPSDISASRTGFILSGRSAESIQITFIALNKISSVTRNFDFESEQKAKQFYQKGIIRRTMFKTTADLVQYGHTNFYNECLLRYELSADIKIGIFAANRLSQLEAIVRANDLALRLNVEPKSIEIYYYLANSNDERHLTQFTPEQQLKLLDNIKLDEDEEIPNLIIRWQQNGYDFNTLKESSLDFVNIIDYVSRLSYPARHQLLNSLLADKVTYNKLNESGLGFIQLLSLVHPKKLINFINNKSSLLDTSDFANNFQVNYVISLLLEDTDKIDFFNLDKNGVFKNKLLKQHAEKLFDTFESLYNFVLQLPSKRLKYNYILKFIIHSNTLAASISEIESMVRLTFPLEAPDFVNQLVKGALKSKKLTALMKEEDDGYIYIKYADKEIITAAKNDTSMEKKTKKVVVSFDRFNLNPHSEILLDRIVILSKLFTVNFTINGIKQYVDILRNLDDKKRIMIWNLNLLNQETIKKLWQSSRYFAKNKLLFHIISLIKTLPPERTANLVKNTITPLLLPEVKRSYIVSLPIETRQALGLLDKEQQVNFRKNKACIIRSQCDSIRQATNPTIETERKQDPVNTLPNSYQEMKPNLKRQCKPGKLDNLLDKDEKKYCHFAIVQDGFQYSDLSYSWYTLNSQLSDWVNDKNEISIGLYLSFIGKQLKESKMRLMSQHFSLLFIDSLKEHSDYLMTRVRSNFFDTMLSLLYNKEKIVLTLRTEKGFDLEISYIKGYYYVNNSQLDLYDNDRLKAQLSQLFFMDVGKSNIGKVCQKLRAILQVQANKTISQFLRENFEKSYEFLGDDIFKNTPTSITLDIKRRSNEKSMKLLETSFKQFCVINNVDCDIKVYKAPENDSYVAVELTSNNQGAHHILAALAKSKITDLTQTKQPIIPTCSPSSNTT